MKRARMQWMIWGVIAILSFFMPMSSLASGMTAINLIELEETSEEETTEAETTVEETTAEETTEVETTEEEMTEEETSEEEMTEAETTEEETSPQEENTVDKISMQDSPSSEETDVSENSRTTEVTTMEDFSSSSSVDLDVIIQQIDELPTADTDNLDLILEQKEDIKALDVEIQELDSDLLEEISNYNKLKKLLSILKEIDDVLELDSQIEAAPEPHPENYAQILKAKAELVALRRQVNNLENAFYDLLEHADKLEYLMRYLLPPVEPESLDLSTDKSEFEEVIYEGPTMYLPLAEVIAQNQYVLQYMTDTYGTDPADFWFYETPDTVAGMAESIVGNVSEDAQKLELIYDWVRKNVYYDYDYYYHGDTRPSPDSEDVLSTQRAVCEGYACLLQDMLISQGIPCVRVIGMAGYDDYLEWEIDDHNHSWNVVCIDDRWIYVDPTWDSGNRYEYGKFYQSIWPISYFNPDIEWFSESHRTWKIEKISVGNVEKKGLIYKDGNYYYYHLGQIMKNCFFGTLGENKNYCSYQPDDNMRADDLLLYLGSDGAAVSGWQQLNDKWYYFDVNNQCSAVSGWQQSGSYMYYLDSLTRTMVTESQIIDGEYCILGRDGRLIKKISRDSLKVIPKKITNTVSGIHIYWNSVEDAEKYTIYRSGYQNGTYKKLKETTADHYVDTAVTSGKSYYYKIVASYDELQSELSNPIGITFVNTPDITLRVNRSGSIGLGWEKIPGATGYAIYRKPYDSGTWARVATITDPNTLKWEDISVKNKNGEIYRYTIRALAGANRNILSGCRSTGRTMVRLTTEKLYSATSTGTTAILGKWSKNAEATGYEVRFMVGNTVYKTFTYGNINTVVKTIRDLPTGNTYKIQVRSYKKVDGVGSFYSAWSQAIFVDL